MADERSSAADGQMVGKVAAVTGGANGIGAACSRRLGAEGASVLVADLQLERAQQVADEINTAGGRAAAVSLDAADRSSNEAMVAAAVDHFGALDVMITAAGISHGHYVSGDIDAEAERVQDRLARMDQPWESVVELDDQDWQNVIDVNLTGTMHAARAAAQVMIEQRRAGSIITIASIAAKDPGAGPLPYCVSKAGVWMLTKHLARALGPTGIRVNAIGPGFIDTNMVAALDRVEVVGEMLMAQIPLGRKGTPDEVANLALFLAGDQASYVTGALMHPHGGWFTG